MFSVYNFIRMDDEQIEKFIKLYGEGHGNFSLARVLPEYAENDARENENGEGLELRTILSGKVSFDTEDLPPIPIYEKMAKDGLVFKIDWQSEDMIEWGIGHGEVRDGAFYHCIDFEETANYVREWTGEEWDPSKSAFAEEYSKLHYKKP